jgi:hypothetical protein
MWKPSKDDSLFLISSVFVGIRNNRIEYYLFFESPKDNMINISYLECSESNIEQGTFTSIPYYLGYNNVNLKKLLKELKEFEKIYDCEVYYYPKSLKENQTIFDIMDDIQDNFEKHGLE